MYFVVEFTDIHCSENIRTVLKSFVIAHTRVVVNSSFSL